MLSPGRGSSVIDLIESNADDEASSTQQTDFAHSTNGFHSQPPETKSVSDDSTNDQPSSTSKSKPYTPMPTTRGKTTGARALLSTTSSKSNPENRIKKQAVYVSRKPKKHTQFKHYRHPSGITAITKAMETLETTVDDDDVESPNNTPPPVKDSVYHRLVTLKYRSSRTASASASPTGEHTIIDSSSSDDQHHHESTTKDRDIMRITSILNDATPSMIPSPPTSDPSSIAASNDGASASASSPQTVPSSPPVTNPSNHRIIGHSSDEKGKSNDNVRSPFARTSLQDECVYMFTRPERQRYEEALLEIVGDLELPF